MLFHLHKMIKMEGIKGLGPLKECFDIQDFYLDFLQYKNLTATFFLLNGFQIKGHLKHYDGEVFIIESGDKQQMVYKQAISTIMPAHNIAFPEEY